MNQITTVGVDLAKEVNRRVRGSPRRDGVRADISPRCIRWLGLRACISRPPKVSVRC